MATNIERTITVPGSADKVFAYVADFSNTAEWDPGIVSAERTGSGPVGEGSAFDLVARFKGRDLATTYRITEFDPPSRVVLVGGTNNFTSTDIITVTPATEGVQIGYRAIFELSGIMRLSEPFLKGTFNRLADDAVAGLKVVLSR
ncbi:MAG TPA: SRPBCC family protein [Acidimicrobiia bacterium]|jgi:carbon monoxide dehydrogenase subunit G|nr:SRPBCC family protein [Acidimicrobiia bacterium]